MRLGRRKTNLGRFRLPLRRAFLYVILLVIALISLWPFYWMALISLRSIADYYTWPPQLLPIGLTPENYINLLVANRPIDVAAAGSLTIKVPFYRNVLNSLTIALGYTVLSVFIASLAGFAFSKYSFPGKEVLFALLLASMMIPPYILLIPLFVLISRLHLANTYLGVILPWAGSAFGIFWMRQYISSIPDELIDAAVIDGASPFQVFRSVILPLSRPGVAALAFLMFLTSWNDFLWPLIVLRKSEMQTIPVALSALEGQLDRVPYPLIMAGSTISVIPIIILFLLVQRQFIAGLISGGVNR